MSKEFLNYLREEIFSWKSYPASASGFPVKLDAMESPYPMQPEVKQAWQNKLKECDINRYPQSKPLALHQRLAQHAQIPDTCSLIFGNGSDELIQLLMMALARPGACVLSPEPSFSVYPMVANIVNLQYESIALQQDNFALDKAAVLTAIAEKRPALVCLAQPNNPTGNLWQKESVEEIIQRTPGYVLIDEAYMPFASRHCMQLLNQYENVLILRTFSKIGFAGLRFGFLVARHELIEQLDKLRLPYNTGSLVHAGIEFALDYKDYFQQQVDSIRVLRDILFEQLGQFPNIRVFVTETNFILFQCLTNNADEVFSALKEQGILIKNLSAEKGLGHCLRVTVGSTEENDLFIQAMREILSRG